MHLALTEFSEATGGRNNYKTGQIKGCILNIVWPFLLLLEMSVLMDSHIENNRFHQAVIKSGHLHPAASLLCLVMFVADAMSPCAHDYGPHVLLTMFKWVTLHLSQNSEDCVQILVQLIWGGLNEYCILFSPPNIYSSS